MKDKKLIAAIIILIIAVAGYFAFVRNITPSTENVTPTPTDTSTSQGKLDINVVCEGALAYMTFPDATSSDKFVAECKEGKHPDVIERFKAQMNLGEGAAI